VEYNKAKSFALRKTPKFIKVYAADPVDDSRDTRTDPEALKTILINSVVHDIDILSWITPASSTITILKVTPIARLGVTIDFVITHLGGETTAATILFHKVPPLPCH
jgi:hypothetical protein